MRYEQVVYLNCDYVQIREWLKDTLFLNDIKSTFNIITGDRSNVTQVIISSMEGKHAEVIKHPLASGLMSIGGALKPGMYIVQVYGKTGVKSFKVVKAK